LILDVFLCNKSVYLSQIINMSFITQLVDKVYSNRSIQEPVVFVLPSRRAAVFLKKVIKKRFESQSFFMPKIYDIDSFMGELSQLERIDRLDLLFEFYTIYCAQTPKQQQEPFDSFVIWASTLLKDFNDISAYLVDMKQVFSHIEDIKKIEAWQVDGEDTVLVKRYKQFWVKIKDYYSLLNDNLLDNNKAYQGLQYREAVKNLTFFKPKGQLVFAGFNALTKAEEVVVQHFLDDGAEIYWDIDKRIYEDYNQESALFIRKYVQNWNYYKTHKIAWLGDNFDKKNKKNIQLVAVSKQIGQANYINELLSNKKSVTSTAVVLNDENLLNPVLNTLTSVDNLNITMGFPVKFSNYGNLFNSLLRLYENAVKYSKGNTLRYYHKDVLNFLGNPLIQRLINQEELRRVARLINKNNWVFLGEKQLKKLVSSIKNIDYLFIQKTVVPQEVFDNCLQLIQQLQRDKTSLDNEYLLHFYKLFTKLANYNKQYNFIKDIKTLYSFFQQLLSQETIDLQGEPLQGLQLMGMLESRMLDFDTLIMTSVNEGVLPSGQSNNSFIPFEVRISNELPTYQERDAIFSYHFFRLLYRVENAYLLYNTALDAFGSGEQSRFLLQLKNEWQDVFSITETVISPKLITSKEAELTVWKNAAILDRLKEIAVSGFSPSAFSSYLRNPLDFYYKRILKVYEEDEVNEEVAANTFGTIVHNTLEALYKPYIDTVLSKESLTKMKSKVELLVAKYFVSEYKNESYQTGKNKIAFEVAKKYIIDFINKEIKAVADGSKIIIRHLETEFLAPFDHPAFDFPITIKGIVDRIDECDGVMRVIDYKTGVASATSLGITNWDKLFTTDKEKAFQVLTYAYLLQEGKQVFRDENRAIIKTKDTGLVYPYQVGVLSFKNQAQGFLPFYYSEKKVKEEFIQDFFIDNYKEQLASLLITIFDAAIPFEVAVTA